MRMIFLYASHVHEGFAENMDYGLSKLYLPCLIHDDYKMCVREQKKHNNTCSYRISTLVLIIMIIFFLEFCFVINARTLILARCFLSYNQELMSLKCVNFYLNTVS